jgi:hypothetical protein
LVVHGTKKFRARVGEGVDSPGEVTTVLGRWYATALLWRPQLALFVHDSTLLPVLMPLAPAATVLDRFPERLAEMLEFHGVARPVIDREVAAMTRHCLTSTASRSVVGVMNELTFLAKAYRSPDGVDDLDVLSKHLAQTPCGPLYKSHISPDRELAALLADQP